MSGVDPASLRNRSLVSAVFSAVSISVGLFVIFVFQFMSPQLLNPIAKWAINNNDLSAYSGETLINEMFVSATQTVPKVAGAGLVIIGLVNEYRRRRTATQQRVR